MKRYWLAWLLLTLITLIALCADQILQQQRAGEAYFNQQFNRIAAYQTQNETLLPLLTGDENLASLQTKFPQLILLEHTVNRALNAPRFEEVSGGRYWLYNPYRQIRMLVDLHFALQTPDVALALAFHIHAQPAIQAAAYAETARWQWQRPFINHYQPFLLKGSANPDWRALHMLPFMLALLLWLVIGGIGWWLLCHWREHVEMRLRADYFQRTRREALGEFTAGIIHEINQPLTAINTWLHSSQLLLKQGKYENLPQALNAMNLQTERLAALLQRFRDIVSERPVAMSAVSPEAVWRRVTVLLQQELDNGNVALKQQFQHGQARVLSDPQWLEQVFHNLLQNAIHMQQQRPDAWVKIASEHASHSLKIIISDNGPGFSAEGLAQACMPFYSSRANSMGLGMTLVESLMLRMNGQMRLANRAEGGAEITLIFQLAE
jgi:C4-dicarboxylate-specific signal transduction histidine kinase